MFTDPIVYPSIFLYQYFYTDHHIVDVSNSIISFVLESDVSL